MFIGYYYNKFLLAGIGGTVQMEIAKEFTSTILKERGQLGAIYKPVSNENNEKDCK